MKSALNFLKSFPEILTRITRSGKIIKEIDGLRFLAIIPVVMAHVSERMTRNTDIEFASSLHTNYLHFFIIRGGIGVYIFFAISGFILCLPFAKRALNNKPGPDLKKYFWRRVTRLEPPYILVMLILFCGIIIKGDYIFSDLLPHLGASLIYMHNIAYSEYPVINPVAWSLEIEIQFYILAPLLAKLIFSIHKTILRRIFLIGITIFFISCQHYFGWDHSPYKITILYQLQYFLVGFLLVDFYLVDWKNSIKNHWVWDLIAIISYWVIISTWRTGGTINEGTEDYLYSIIFSIAIFFLLFSIFKGVIVNKFFTLPWITAIGGMCYTIYLLHLAILEVFIGFTKGIVLTNIYWVNLLLQATMLLPVVFIFSVIFFLLIEKPCMDKDWIKKLRLGRIFSKKK